MMPAAYPRRIAALLLRFAIWIAPHDSLDWGRGTLGELNMCKGIGRPSSGPLAARAFSQSTPCFP